MGKTISATDTVRRFSEILNSIKYRGDRYTILRSGKPVASILPAEATLKEKTLEELIALLNKIPKMGNEVEKFKNDLKEILKSQPSIPEKSRWA